MIGKFCKPMFSALTKQLVNRRFEELSVAHGSSVAYWRIRPKDRNHLVVGERSIVNTKIIFERELSRVEIGKRTFLGMGTISVALSVEIGDDVLVAWGTSICDHGSHSVSFSKRSSDVEEWGQGQKDWSNVHIAPVRIHNRAWVGFNSIILAGRVIGEGAIVGAGAVVTRDVDPWTIVAGNPARFIREIPRDER